VVTADEGYPIWIPDFEAEEQEKGFERVEPPIDEVAHEEVIRVWNIAANAEEFHQVMELAVDVTAYRDGGVDGDDIAFFDEQFSRFVAEFSDLGFGDWSTGAELRYGST
jgi:hypothetical protein